MEQFPAASTQITERSTTLPLVLLQSYNQYAPDDAGKENDGQRTPDRQ